MTDALVVIHVRFAPNGEVTEISERPGDTTAQGWFNKLSRHRSNGYQPLSGGRALFRISRGEIDSLKVQPANNEV